MKKDNKSGNYFIRDYRLKISVQDVKYTDGKATSFFDLGSFEIDASTDCNIQFTGEKQVGGVLGKLNLRIFNLSREKRNLLVKDGADDSKLIRVELLAGYVGSILTIFKGSVFRGTVEKQNYDIINIIETGDGYFEASQDFVSQSIEAGKGIVAQLADAAGFTKGKIEEDKTLRRDKVIHGSGLEKIRDLSDEDVMCSIIDEVLYFHKPKVPLISKIAVINASTGLIGVPNKSVDRVEISMKINPSIALGALIKLESTVNPASDGYYVVEKISYSGEYNGGDWNQNVSAYEFTGGVVVE